jgi:hypothetical protein
MQHMSYGIAISDSHELWLAVPTRAVGDIVVPGLAGRLPGASGAGPPAGAVGGAEGAAGQAQGSVRSDPTGLSICKEPERLSSCGERLATSQAQLHSIDLPAPLGGGIIAT